MEKKIDLEVPTKISQKKIYDLYCNHYDAIQPLFIEFQFAWFQHAYEALGDIDKHNILTYLYKEHFVELNEAFKVKSLNEFYSNPRFDLENINIIHVSKKLMLSKETARRKISELERDGLLIKNKKTITVTLAADPLQKTEHTINSFAKILDCVSYFLHKDNYVEKYCQKEFYVKKIKERFTQILAIFLEYQIEYILKRKALANNDMEMLFIFGTLAYNQVMFLKKNKKKIHYKDEWLDKFLYIGDKKGLNAMTISDLTMIPRPTVIRKLQILLKQKDLYKDDKNLYYIKKGKLSFILNKERLNLTKEISSLIYKINNIIFNT